MHSDKNLDVVILGAPRSGTNMLREVLTSLPDVCTWPCDEINYIWRYGNRAAENDEFDVRMVTSEISSYVRCCFDAIRRKYNCNVVVEKTCANTLRVPYVKSILPNAKYIFIIRDGIDAVGSAKERWAASLNIPYIFSKARFIPLRDIPYYTYKYFISRIRKLMSKDGRLPTWGPIYSGMPDNAENLLLTDICALQWQKCVEAADQALCQFGVDEFIYIRYEEFVTDPLNQCKNIVNFLGLCLDDIDIEKAVAAVSNNSLGKGRSSLGVDEVKRLESLIGNTLNKFGY